MTGSFIYRLVLRRKFQSRVVIPCSQTKVFLFVYWWHQTFQLHPLLPSSFLIFQSFLFFLFFVGCSDRFCLLHCSCLVIWSVVWNLPCERHTQPPENILHYIHALVHKIKYKHAQTKTHNCNNILLQNILQAGTSSYNTWKGFSFILIVGVNFNCWSIYLFSPLLTVISSACRLDQVGLLLFSSLLTVNISLSGLDKLDLLLFFPLSFLISLSSVNGNSDLIFWSKVPFRTGLKLWFAYG